MPPSGESTGTCYAGRWRASAGCFVEVSNPLVFSPFSFWLQAFGLIAGARKTHARVACLLVGAGPAFGRSIVRLTWQRRSDSGLDSAGAHAEPAHGRHLLKQQGAAARRIDWRTVATTENACLSPTQRRDKPGSAQLGRRPYCDRARCDRARIHSRQRMSRPAQHHTNGNDRAIPGSTASTLGLATRANLNASGPAMRAGESSRVCDLLRNLGDTIQWQNTNSGRT